MERAEMGFYSQRREYSKGQKKIKIGAFKKPILENMSTRSWGERGKS